MKANNVYYRFKCKACHLRAKSIMYEFVQEKTLYYEIYCQCNRCGYEQMVYIHKNTPKKPLIPLNGARAPVIISPIPHETTIPKTTQ